MTDRNRRLILLFSALAIVALLLLAAGLGGLELQPGRPFSGQLTTATENGAGPRQAPAALVNALFLALGLLIALLLVFYLLLGSDRRRGWLYILALLLGLLGFYLAARANPPEELVPPASGIAPGGEAPEEGFPAAPATPGIELEVQPPAWLAWLAAALLALVAAGLVLGTGWLLWMRAQQPPDPLPQLTQQAQAALAELEAGGDVRDVVMRCYLEMSRILEQERGLVRNETMTAREFKAALHSAGLPRDPVARLTRLFEEVRYGTAWPDRVEEEQAVACLSAIVAVCRSTI